MRIRTDKALKLCYTYSGVETRERLTQTLLLSWRLQVCVTIPPTSVVTRNYALQLAGTTYETCMSEPTLVGDYCQTEPGRPNPPLRRDA